jgi:ABC-type spermidine/putrescine transport system permease subunit II
MTMERALKSYVVFVYGLMYLPIAVVAIFSLNASEMIAFPLQGFTLDWYRQALGDGRLLGGFGITMRVALPTALLSTALGAMAALAATRYAFRGKPVFLLLLAAPFFIPKIILAVSHLILLADLGIAKGLLTIVIGQTLIILPFTTLVVASVLIRIDPRIEEAAADLGADGWSTFLRVHLPLMRNGLVAASFIAFVLSSSEYVVTSFLSGRTQPLSVLVASDFRFHLSPTLDALAILIVMLNVLLVAIGEVIRRRSEAARDAQM